MVVKSGSVVVALLAEGVDRNSIRRKQFGSFSVALLAEGVDRNPVSSEINPGAEVALLAEGVDRNWQSPLQSQSAFWSPSSRRAWIEI